MLSRNRRMNWFYSIVRVAGAGFPVSSMLVQLQAEIDAEQIDLRISRLEDPISQLHSDIRALSEIIYGMIKQNDDLRIYLKEDDCEKYSRALAALESQSLIDGSHTINRRFECGFRVVDPTYVMYMCALFETSESMEKLYGIIENCSVGQQIDGEQIQETLNLPLSVIGSAFNIYESKGFGICSRIIGQTIYLGKA